MESYISEDDKGGGCGGGGGRTMSIGVIDFLLISVTCALKLHSKVFCYGY